MAPELGPTAYIIKPFRISALIALLRIHIYNHQESQSGALIIGQYIFKPSSNLLIHRDNRRVLNLTYKETAILKFPAVSIRTSTERPEAIDSGSLILGSLDENNILNSNGRKPKRGVLIIIHK